MQLRRARNAILIPILSCFCVVSGDTKPVLHQDLARSATGRDTFHHRWSALDGKPLVLESVAVDEHSKFFEPTRLHTDAESTRAQSANVGSFARFGIASFYKDKRTASGERMNPRAFTAAHSTLPFGTKVVVTNPHNGRSVVVTINDRGPFVGGRVIDLSPAAARALGITRTAGIASVSLAVDVAGIPAPVLPVPAPRSECGGTDCYATAPTPHLERIVTRVIAGGGEVSTPPATRQAHALSDCHNQKADLSFQQFSVSLGCS